MKKKLTVIVPCYNEELALPYFYNEINKVSKKLLKVIFEVIFVDDGSTDKTLEVIKDMVKKDERIRFISFSRNFGKEAAMLAGLKHCNGKYVAIMDADLQHTPEVLLKMYDKLIKNPEYDVVASYKESRYDEKTIKRTLISLFYRINNFVSDVKLLPGASDFRIFKSAVKDAIVSLPEKTRFLKGIFAWVGFNTIYMPYTPSKREYGTSKWSIFKLIKYSLGGIISFSTKPIKGVFVIGLLCFMICLINFILMGYLSSRTIILLIGIVLLCLGVISLYISRIYSNLLGRPCYIIREKIGFEQKKVK